MSNHLDPFHRRESFHSSPLNSSSAVQQEKRRRLALDAQKQRRTHAIEAARSSSRDLFDIEDLSIAGSASESDTEVPLPSSNNRLAEDQPPPVISKQKRKNHKPTFKSWAKNLLSQGETLDLREGLLPSGLEKDWRMSVVPKGKRCLCATTNETAGKNTILYSRVAGRTLGRVHSSLPGDCLLDVIWDREQSILWVLDTCKWRGNYIVECEADFRAFFTTSKLAELETQYYFPPKSTSTSNPSSLLILPCPTYSSPLVPSVLLPILSTLSVPSPLPVSVLLPSIESNLPSRQTINVNFLPTGLLLYHRESHYESGITPLVNWIPLEVEAGRESCEGVGRFRELVCKWQERGGEGTGQSREGEGEGEATTMDQDSTVIHEADEMISE